MQIFELHFNPKLREEQIFDSFVYEPENIYEKKLGNLYTIGELQNALPQNLNFLDILATVIKRNYYTLSLKSPERALSQSLKRVNDFLAEEVKKDNVNWLGNLNFAVLALKDFNLFFTKTGTLKILLLRTGQVIDIGKNLDLREIEPYPVKIFLNVVLGKLAQGDIILILTKEIFDFFQQQNILIKLAQTDELNSKKIKEILPPSLFTKGDGSKVSGICFLAVVAAETRTVKFPTSVRQIRKISFQKETKFSLSQIFSPLLRPIKAISKLSLPRLPKLKIRLPRPKIKPFTIFKKFGLFGQITQKMVKGKLPIKIPCPPKFCKAKFGWASSAVEKFRPNTNFKKKLILLLFLFILLFFGFLAFRNVEEKKENNIKNNLSQIQEKVNQAENLLIFKNEEEANSLLKEAWQEISSLTEKTPLKDEALSLKQSIEEKLEKLNKLEKIENPEEASAAEYERLSASSVPPTNLEPAEPGFDSDLFAPYLSNLYFLDKKTCKIIKYPYLGNFKWGSPTIWIEQNDKCSEPKSMTIDGSVWVLNKDNSIIQYHKGAYQKTIELDFFPFPENITKIKTKANIPYIYLLEPVKKRIIIIDREGKILRQFQSENFDDLKDFDISENGKTIWLLNSQQVYKIELEL